MPKGEDMRLFLLPPPLKVKEVMFSPLSVFVCLLVCLSVCRYLKRLWTDPDEILWTHWVCDKDELIWFWWRSKSGSGYENYLILKVIFHHWEIRSKTVYRMIFQKYIRPDMFSWIRHYVAEVCALPSALLVFIMLPVVELQVLQYQCMDPVSESSNSWMVS